MKFKKVLSGILTGALLLTSIAPVSAAVEEVPVVGVAEEIVSEQAEAPVPVAEYGFEDTLQNDASDEVDEATPLAKLLKAYSGEVSYTEGRVKGTKALKLGDYGIQLNKKNIGKNFTVSAWVKTDSATLAENQNVMFLGYHNPEKWVGIVGLNGSQKLKIWTRDVAANSGFNNHTTLNDQQTLPQGEWHCLTISQDESGQTTLYKDGEQVGSVKAAAALDGANQDVYIGVNNWDPLFVGAVDDVQVYDKVLTADEVYDYCYDPVKPVLSDEAIEVYDFDDFDVSANDAAVLTDGAREISLVAKGSGTAPSLVDDADRGQVLKTVAQGTQDDGLNNIGYAQLPNPFQGQSVENGLTLNFWANTQSAAAGNRTLIDFEVAPGTGKADPDRAGTFAFNQSMVYWNTTSQDGNFTDFNVGGLGLSSQNVWKMVTMTVTKDGISFYSNGQLINHTISSGTENYEKMIGELAGTDEICTDRTWVRLGASVAAYWIGAGSLLDDISFFGRALSAGEVATLYDQTATAEEATAITISGETALQVDKTTQLTAALTPADATGRSDMRWSSSDENVVKVDQNGFVQAAGAGKAVVTARIGSLVSNELEITVEEIEKIKELKEGYWLAVYTTTTPFYASAANVDQETQSVYFAVSKDGKNFEVLNNGGGVIFSKNDAGSKKIIEPKIYKNGSSFTVIAADANKSAGYHVFTSKDGVHFYDDEIVEFPSQTSGVLEPASFTLNLKGKNLLTEDKNLSLGNAVELTTEQYTYIVNKLGTVVNDGLQELENLEINKGDALTDAALAEQYPTATATYTDGSTQKFNIDWSDAAASVDTTKAGEYTVTGKVVQTKYLNKLKEINGSTLPEDDPENVNPDFPKHYDPATGTVYYDETKFVEGMADPMIYWDEQTGYYYMTGSYFPEKQDAMEGETPEQYDRVVLRRGRTLEELQDRSKQVTIWKVGNQGYEDRNGNDVARGYRYIWAPEIHRVGDNWVVYFTESQTTNLFGIYCHALVLPGDQDPYETALTYATEPSQWKDYQMRGGTGLTKAIVNSFCLDMTYFKDEKNGQSYVVWASSAYGVSSLYLAKVNEEQPWELDSEIMQLTVPQYGWENIRYVVNEGATVLQRDGNIFLCYSAAGTGSEYAIGMMTAKAGTDLLKNESWTKSPYPLLSSHDVDGEEGPGHNSFTVDKDGNAIFVYHARPTSHNYKMCGWNGTSSSFNNEPLNDPCRHARLKRVHWSADGTPILKMTYENELLAENETITAKVVVKESAVKPTPTVSPTPAPFKSHKGETFISGNFKYKVTADTKTVHEVRVTSLKNKKTAKLVIPATAKKWDRTYKVTSIKAKAFKGAKCTKVTIGNNVSVIGPNAFLNCKSLKTVVIGKKVKTIGVRAFYGCKKLTKVTIKSTVLKNVKKNAFKQISKKAVIKVPKNKKNEYRKYLKGRIAKGVKIK